MEPELAIEREDSAGEARQSVTAVTPAASARRLMDRMRGSLGNVEERVEQRGAELLRMARKQPALAVGAAAAGDSAWHWSLGRGN